MLGLIDTHAHLDFPQYEDDLGEVIQRAIEAGLEAIINVGTGEASSVKVVEQADRNPRLWAAVGIHPHNAAKVSSRCMQELEYLARGERVVAIGETGLDFYRNLSPAHRQEDLFRQHLRLAVKLNKPVIVHSREANKETLRVLKEEPLPDRIGIMHCFSGSLQDAHDFVTLGFYLSVAGPLTYPRSHGLRELLKEVPLERLLFETDAPYLSPQPYRGMRNEPAYIKATYERAALALDIDVEELAAAVRSNVGRLFPTVVSGA